MQKLILLSCATMLLLLSGCNQGEIALLKEQVADLKQENAELRDRLDEANIKVAKLEGMKEEWSAQVGKLKELMPDVKGLGDALESVKDRGLSDLKDFSKEQLLKKAKEGFDKATK